MGPTRLIFAGPLAALLVAFLAFPGAAPAQAPQARAQDAATQHRSERTEQANRDAAVADEASTAAPARAVAPDPAAGTRASQAPRLSYGPALAPRGQQGADAVRKDPAEVRDETDTLAREAAPQPHNQQLTNSRGEKLGGKELEEQRRRAARRHPAWQPEGPIAPRPLRAGESPPASAAAASAAVPIPPPLPAPQPTVPSSSVIRACQGSVCTDAAGNTFNGAGNAGVSTGGRLCARSGVTVQCF